MYDNIQVQEKITHLFRHQSGKMVSTLTRIFGAHNIELAEDVVQDTLLTALEQWKFKGIPENAEAWLFIVAKNKALNVIKKQRSNVLFGDEITKPLLHSGYTIDNTFKQLAEEENLIKDDQLRMMFACCHPQINEESQIALILKILCGFSIAEIARAFLTNEETITKRLYRAKQFFREQKIKYDIPSSIEIKERVDSVLKTIYLILNEGYNSTHSEELIRKDLIEEAFRLCHLLTENKCIRLSAIDALQALICFHAARITSRINTDGNILLLHKQDRNLWNKKMIELGINYLTQSAEDELSIYHVEAMIAYEHCMAINYKSTNWKNILHHYDVLLQLKPSYIVELNRVIVIAELYGTNKALQEIENLNTKKELDSYYLYHATIGELYFRIKRYTEAKIALEKAVQLTHSKQEKELLLNKINLCK